MFTRQDIVKSVDEFVISANENNIIIEKILLFGSYALGKPHKYSDIDLAVFSPQFNGYHYQNNKLIQHTKRLPQMQLHLYHIDEYDDDLFVQEIKKYAIDVTPEMVRNT